jgi:hypothetical protein
MTGAYAEQIAVPASAVLPIPDGLTEREAAAFQVTFRTAYHALRTIGELRPGGGSSCSALPALTVQSPLNGGGRIAARQVCRADEGPPAAVSG